MKEDTSSAAVAEARRQVAEAPSTLARLLAVERFFDAIQAEADARHQRRLRELRRYAWISLCFGVFSLAFLAMQLWLRFT